MNNEKCFYTYELYDAITGLSYIGSRTTKNMIGKLPEEDSDYRGSLCNPEWIDQWEEISKRCEKTILGRFSTPEETIHHEIYLHKRNKVGSNPNYFNKVEQTSTGFSFNRTHSEESKKKMSINTSGDKNPNWGGITGTHLENLRIALNKINKDKIGKKKSFKNKETLQKIRDLSFENFHTQSTCKFCGFKSTKGNIGRWHNEKCKENPNRVMPTTPKKGKDNPMYGRKLSEEHKNKISGHTPWNKNKKGLFSHSEETRKEMSKSRKGKKYNCKSKRRNET